MVNAMVAPTSGTVFVRGRDVAAEDPVRLRRSIGYVLQEGGLFPHRTVADNVATIPRLEGATKQASRERALEQAPATDQDSYVVTAEFAHAHSLTSIGDLTGAGTLTLGGNSELQTRPYGPTGLSQTYGVTVGFTPIEDSGGPLTVKALKDGDIQLANIYSSDPALADGTLQVLDDPKGLFLASHVVPLASSRVNDDAVAVINRVSEALDAQDLVEMNRASTMEQKSASQIAREWLLSEGLVS